MVCICTIYMAVKVNPQTQPVNPKKLGKRYHDKNNDLMTF